MTTTVDAPASTDPREALGEKLIEAMAATLEVFAVHLGVELGLYRALEELGTATSAELAAQAGIDPRYAREWLEQQAVSGLIDAEEAPNDAPLDAPRDTDARAFRLPPAHADVLLHGESPFYAAGGATMVAGVARILHRLPGAYRTGTGVPYADFGREIRAGIAAFNRPMFLHELGSSWLPSVPEIDNRLRDTAPARVLDLGCGLGTSSIAIAKAYPHVQVVGVDLDDASVAEGAAAAEAAGLADRVTFVAGDAADVAAAGEGYDLVTIFEALHDMGDPAGALRTARSLLRAGGSVLVADEGVAESFTAPGDLIERFNYGWSVTHCLPATMAESPVEANGTVLRPRTVRRWASEAGFSRCVVLEIDNPFWRFYRLSE